MADEQDRPDQPRQANPPAADPPASDQKPVAKKTPAKAANTAAEKPPAKAAKKTPAKKAPAKANKTAKAAKKAPPKKAPPRAEAALPPEPPIAAEPIAASQPEVPEVRPSSPKSVPRLEPEPPIAAEPIAAATLADTNGEGEFAAAVNEAAAQARASIDTAGESLADPIARVPGSAGSRLPIAVAIAVSLLAILLIRRLFASDED
jgi:hypothetical protein